MYWVSGPECFGRLDGWVSDGDTLADEEYFVRMIFISALDFSPLNKTPFIGVSSNIHKD